MSDLTCVICSRRQPRTGMVCDPDRDRLGRLLGVKGEIVELYALLPGQLPPGQATGPRVSGSREAPLPLRVDPLDLTMPAPTGQQLWTAVSDPYKDQAGHLGVAPVLDSWVRDWIDVRDMRESAPVPTVMTLAGWLGNRLDWACDNHPAIDEFAAEVFKLAGTLRVTVGLRGDRVKVGRCPIVPTEGENRKPCNATLTADPYLDVIRCPKCDTMWARDKWIWLGLTIRAA